MTAHPARALAAVGLGALLAACGPRAEPGPPADVPVATVGDPVVEIGVVDGPDEYIFATIESVVRLGDGSIGVSDAGATRIGVYDASGRFVRRWGSEGDGPQEFSALSRLYPLGPDSVLAAERYTGRVALYDLEGSLGREVAATDLSGDTTFTLDSWLYRRFWVEGALRAPERARVRATLDRLPSPRQEPGFRVVRVASEGGDVWIREPTAAGSPRRWTRLDGAGTPRASIHLPQRFRPTDIRGDDLLGVWVGEGDVHFVRAYRLVDTGEREPVPAWLRGGSTVAAAEPAPDDEELMRLMVGAIRSMARAQEIHYSTAMSYTTDVEALSAFERPEGLGVAFTRGDPRGWSAVFTHPAVDRVCGLAYGFETPPGWMPGKVVCAPAPAASPAGEG